MSVIHSQAESLVNALYTTDILAGTSGVLIMTSVTAIMPDVEECMQKLCNDTTLIALVKNATAIRWKTPCGSQIHSSHTATTIL